MTTTCLIKEMQSVSKATNKTVASYEASVNELLDKLYDYRKSLVELNESIADINKNIEGTVCSPEEAQLVILKARALMKSFRILITKARESELYGGYRSVLHDLILTVEDFEEYMQDFKFRHDREAQDKIQELLKGFTLSV